MSCSEDNNHVIMLYDSVSRPIPNKISSVVFNTGSGLLFAVVTTVTKTPISWYSDAFVDNYSG